MGTETIDVGIHLGATNSRIAFAQAEKVTVIRNDDGAECTPTAVWLNGQERLIVGAPALIRLGDDADNVVTNFLRQIGTVEPLRFARSARVADPIDLVSVVIRSLCGDARRKLGRVVENAVIIAPADFGSSQRDALVTAAHRAGLRHSLLLQEPVAAALAYGGPAEGAHWLVYDFGGASFDAAVVTLQGGVVTVVAHVHDARLGGDLLDWEIVRKVFAPAVAREARLTAFRSDNPRWRTAFAKLRAVAEEARWRLASESAAEVRIDFLCRDDDGAPVRFQYTFRRDELESLLAPIARRSLKACEEMLKSRELKFGGLDRLVLAGGPARDRYFAEFLAGAGGGVRARVVADIDPLTVVVRGAAMYAGHASVVTAAPPVFVEGREVEPAPLPVRPPAPAPVQPETEEPAHEEFEEPEREPEPKEPEVEEPTDIEEPTHLGEPTELEEQIEPPESEAEGFAAVFGEAEGFPALAGEAEEPPGLRPNEFEEASESQEPQPQEPGLEPEPEPQPEPVDEKSALEQEVLTGAMTLARAGRYDEAKLQLRRLGAVEELSAAAVDLLIRICTAQGQLDWAELVWRFAERHGQVVGENYDVQDYALEKTPVSDIESPSADGEPPADDQPSVPSEQALAPAAEDAEPESAGDEGAREQEVLASARSLALSGRYTDAKRQLRRLGPGEDLSPAAVGLLVGIYTAEGRLDRAELVWRLGKRHGKVEGESYDARDYGLDEAPPADSEPAPALNGQTPSPAAVGEEPEPATNAAGSFLDERLTPGSSSFLHEDANRADESPRQARTFAPLADTADHPSRPVEVSDDRRWPPSLVSAIIAGVILLAIAAVLMVRGCDSYASPVPRPASASEAVIPWSAQSPKASGWLSAVRADAVVMALRGDAAAPSAMRSAACADPSRLPVTSSAAARRARDRTVPLGINVRGA